MAVREFWQKMVREVFAQYGGREMRKVADWIMERFKKCKETSEEGSDVDVEELNGVFELVKVLLKQRNGFGARGLPQGDGFGYFGDGKNEKEMDGLVERRLLREDLNLGFYSLVKPCLFW